VIAIVEPTESADTLWFLVSLARRSELVMAGIMKFSRTIPGRMFGLGIQPERVQTPEATGEVQF
jgi:hypothetical protein